MTVGQDNAIATPAPGAEPNPNSFQRIIGVLFSPDAIFASIARGRVWVAPLLILIVVGLRGGITIAQRIVLNTVARDAMEANPQTANPPADGVEKMFLFTAGTMKVGAYASPV